VGLLVSRLRKGDLMKPRPIDIREFRARKAGEDTPRVIIEELTASLEAGDVEQVAYIFANSKGEAMMCYSDMNKFELIGMLEFWKQQLLEDLVE
jgi:hypothetical protein